MSVFSKCLGRMLFCWMSPLGPVIRAWLVWSCAAETALGDAYGFSGGPIPGRGLVLGRGVLCFRVVRLGGHKVRKALGNAANAVNDSDVFPVP